MLSGGSSKMLKLKLIYDWQSVGHSVSVSGTRLGAATNFSVSLKFCLDTCGCVILYPSSLTRGRVCNLLYNCFWALPEQSLLDRSPAELTAIFYCLICYSPNLEGQVPIFISPRNRVVQLYPRALGSLFVASYDSQSYGGGILTHLHTGLQNVGTGLPAYIAQHSRRQ
jgi:hypothetical protein